MNRRLLNVTSTILSACLLLSSIRVMGQETCENLFMLDSREQKLIGAKAQSDWIANPLAERVRQVLVGVGRNGRGSLTEKDIKGTFEIGFPLGNGNTVVAEYRRVTNDGPPVCWLVELNVRDKFGKDTLISSMPLDQTDNIKPELEHNPFVKAIRKDLVLRIDSETTAALYGIRSWIPRVEAHELQAMAKESNPQKAMSQIRWLSRQRWLEDMFKKDIVKQTFRNILWGGLFVSASYLTNKYMLQPNDQQIEFEMLVTTTMLDEMSAMQLANGKIPDFEYQSFVMMSSKRFKDQQSADLKLDEVDIVSGYASGNSRPGYWVRERKSGRLFYGIFIPDVRGDKPGTIHMSVLLEIPESYGLPTVRQFATDRLNQIKTKIETKIENQTPPLKEAANGK